MNKPSNNLLYPSLGTHVAMHTCMRLLLPALILFVLASCSSISEAPMTPDTDTTIDTGTDTDQPPPLDPLWYSINGVLQISDGLPTEESQLDLSLWGTSNGVPVTTCSQSTHGIGLPSTPPQDEIDVFGFWSFNVPSLGCVGLPTTVSVGIGPLVPSLYPAIDSLGFSPRHTRGLYSTSGELQTELTVFGVAGTAQQLAGNGEPVSLFPLPDGKYQLQGVYLLPL